MMSTGQSVAATGAIGTQLAAVIYWLGNWPIKPIDEPTSLAVSGLILAAIGLLIHRGTNGQSDQAKINAGFDELLAKVARQSSPSPSLADPQPKP